MTSHTPSPIYPGTEYDSGISPSFNSYDPSSDHLPFVSTNVTTFSICVFSFSLNNPFLAAKTTVSWNLSGTLSPLLSFEYTTSIVSPSESILPLIIACSGLTNAYPSIVGDTTLYSSSNTIVSSCVVNTFPSSSTYVMTNGYAP